MTAPLRLRNPSVRTLIRDWRLSFNSLGVSVVMPAPRIVLSPGVTLRPDFYLPGSRQYAVVMPDIDYDLVGEQLMVAAANAVPPRQWVGDDVTDLALIGLCPGGLAIGWERGHTPGLFGIGLYRCAECCLWFFVDESQCWRCQCCGFYDGNAGLLENFSTPLTPFPFLLSPGVV